MAYAPYTPKAKSTPNDFGGLRTDGNRIAMTGALANYSLSQDATTSPVVSPATVNTTLTLTVPQGAVAINIVSTTNAVQITEDSTYTATFSVPAGTIYTRGCANQQYIYLKTGSSTVVNFQFDMV